MANYLKKYVDRVHDVPPQLQRLFKLIRDLDERVAQLQAAVEEKCRASLAASAPTKKQRAKAEAALRDEVNADMQKILSLSEEKVRAARGRAAWPRRGRPGIRCVAWQPACRAWRSVA